MPEGSESNAEDVLTQMSSEKKKAYWAKMRGPTPPPRNGKRPILTRINFFDGFFYFSKRELAPNGCQVCHNLSVDHLQLKGDTINSKFSEIKRNALSGCQICTMIEQAFRHFDVLEPLTRWQEEWRSQQIEHGLEYTFENNHEEDTRFVYISENILKVKISVKPALPERGLDFRVLLVVSGIGTFPPLKLYRP